MLLAALTVSLSQSEHFSRMRYLRLVIHPAVISLLVVSPQHLERYLPFP